MLVENISGGNAFWEPTLGTFGANVRHPEIDQVCLSIVQKAPTVDPNEKRASYEGLTRAFPVWGRDLRGNILGEVLELISRADPERTWGIEFYRELRDEIPGPSKRTALRQLVNDMVGNPIDQMVNTANLVLEDQEVLKRADLVHPIDY